MLVIHMGNVKNVNKFSRDLENSKEEHRTLHSEEPLKMYCQTRTNSVTHEFQFHSVTLLAEVSGG